MKPIKITIDNRAAIQTALNVVNGAATAHTATPESIIKLAMLAELKIISLVGHKKNAPCAIANWHSGAALPSAYKYSRQVTKITIERRAKNWYLTQAHTATAWREAGKMTIVLTQAQNVTAITKFTTQYYVNPK
jgi:hypothetical protein